MALIGDRFIKYRTGCNNMENGIAMKSYYYRFDLPKNISEHSTGQYGYLKKLYL